MNLVKIANRVASLGTFSGFTVEKANFVEYEPMTPDNWAGILAGDFVLISPTGKKIEITGRADSNNLNWKIKVDGKPYLLPSDQEDFELADLDPDVTDDLMGETVDGVLHYLAKSMGLK